MWAKTGHKINNLSFVNLVENFKAVLLFQTCNSSVFVLWLRNLQFNAFPLPSTMRGYKFNHSVINLTTAVVEASKQAERAVTF